MNYELPGLVLLPPGLLPPGASSLRFRLACCFLAVKVNKTMKIYIESIIIYTVLLQKVDLHKNTFVIVTPLTYFSIFSMRHS